MLIGGISFGQKTIWDEISENIKAAELEMDRAFDRMKEEAEGDKEPNEIDVINESLANYVGVLEDKVRELEEENENLHAEIERQDEEIKKRDVEIRTEQEIFNTLRTRCREEARDYFDNRLWGMIEICRVGEKKACDCGNLEKQIEELQVETRDLTVENVRLTAINNALKNANNKGGSAYEELKEKYETADLEREHLAKEISRLQELVRELNERHQQDCIDLDKKQTTINELVDSYSELRRMKGLSE